MRPSIEALFTPDILATVATAFDCSPEQLTSYDGYENFVYGADQGGRRFVLRITHSSRRSVEQLSAECDWLTYLHQHKLPVTKPVLTAAGQQVHTVPHEDGAFLAVGFEEMPGVVLDDFPHLKADFWNKNLFHQWGQVMAKIHLASERYQLEPGYPRRQEWFEDEVCDWQNTIPLYEKAVLAQAKALTARLQALPKTATDYGLIHGDLTQWNFHVDEFGRMHVFDFDTSEYAWFVRDIAAALYYAPMSAKGTDGKFLGEFFHYFLSGYCSVRPLSPFWIEQIPEFLRLHRLQLFTYSHMLIQNASKIGQRDEEAEAFVQYHREAIEFDYPIINLKWSRYRNYSSIA